MSMFEDLDFMKEKMTLQELRGYKEVKEAEIKKWEIRAQVLESESIREQLQYHMEILVKIRKAIAYKEGLECQKN